jgi:tryptophan-rich sensory protein
MKVFANDHIKDAQLEKFLVMFDKMHMLYCILGAMFYVWHADMTAFEIISALRLWIQAGSSVNNPMGEANPNNVSG